MVEVLGYHHTGGEVSRSNNFLWLNAVHSVCSMCDRKYAKESHVLRTIRSKKLQR